MKGEIHETKMHSEFPSPRPTDSELQDHDQTLKNIRMRRLEVKILVSRTPACKMAM